MHVTDLIRRKRDGNELEPAEIEFLVNGYTGGAIPDYQMSAWLMAVVLRGMTRGELAALTAAMLNSGQVLDLSELPAARVDKHSTGGVGDKTSLVVAPIVAAGGLCVPMISGRGLGHTGGTLDKLESIPGFNVNLPVAEFRRVLAQCGAAMIGQTAEIAPADKSIYALRDVTGTVESPYLICASIMSKKLAEGIDALVLDVKTGSGAFMKSEKDAMFLAELMVETGQRLGKRVTALITDMSQPLGRAVGNALEVAECIEILNPAFVRAAGRRNKPAPAAKQAGATSTDAASTGAGADHNNDLLELCLELAGWMFVLGSRVVSLEEGRALAEETLASGKAREKFREMIRLQGGNPAVIDDPGLLPRAKQQLDMPSPDSGFVTDIQCEMLGTAGVLLGGGRQKKEDTVDPAVGIIIRKKIGDKVSAGEPLLTIHFNSPERLERARPLLERSYIIGPSLPGKSGPLIRRVMNAG